MKRRDELGTRKMKMRGERNIKKGWKLGSFGQFRNLPAVMALALSEQWPLSASRATSLSIPPKI